jgi:hypothetical protein
MTNRSYGALPPPGMEWMMGKTVEEIEAIRYEADITGKETSEVAEGNTWQQWLHPGPKG